MSNIYPNANRFSMMIKSVNTEAGLTTDKIQPYQVALVDTKTWKTVSDASTSNSLLVVVGSPNKGGNSNPISGFGDMNNFKESYKSREFFSVLKDSFYTLSPEKPVPFIGYYAWDGVNDCKSPKFECGKNYGIQVRVSGAIIQELYGTYEIFEDYYADAPCCDPCSDSCTLNVGCKSVFEQWIKQLNDIRDGHNQIPYFGKFSLVSDCNVSTPVITTTTWCLEVCDTGDQEALQDVQNQYVGVKVERVDRKKSISRYSFCADGTTAPTPLILTSSVELADCDGTCPENYTLVPASVVYNIERPLAGTEDLTTDALKQTFADAVGSTYSALTSKFLSFSSSSAIIQITVPVTTTVTVQLADKLTFVQTKPTLCTPNANSSISWTACGTGYKTKRELCITVKLDDCVDATTSAANILADIQSVMYTDSSVIPNSVELVKQGNCMAVYSVEQLSDNCMQDGCDTIDTPIFKKILDYKSYQWAECPCLEVQSDDNNCKCGIKVEGYIPNCQPDGCYVNLNKYKNYELPKFEIRPIDPEFGKCSGNHITEFTVAQDPTFETLDGKRVLAEILKFRKGFLRESHISAGSSTDTDLIDVLGLETASGIDQCNNYHVVHALVDYSMRSHVTDATNQLQDIQLFFKDIEVRDQWINLLSTFTLKPNINVPVEYRK